MTLATSLVGRLGSAEDINFPQSSKVKASQAKVLCLGQAPDSSTEKTQVLQLFFFFFKFFKSARIIMGYSLGLATSPQGIGVVYEVAVKYTLERKLVRVVNDFVSGWHLIVAFFSDNFVGIPWGVARSSKR